MSLIFILLEFSGLFTSFTILSKLCVIVEFTVFLSIEGVSCWVEPPNIIPDNNGPLLGIGCGTQAAPEPDFLLVAPFNRLSNLLIYIFISFFFK